MIAKAEGTPINNTQTNYSNSFDQNVAQGKAAIPQIEKTKYLKEKELMETNLVKLQKELDTINEQRMLENQKLRKQENELKEKQEKIDELEMKIKKASTENIDTSQLSSELDALKQDAKTISASIRFLQSESNSLSSQYLSKLNSIQLQQQSIKGLEEKISAI